jgi:hypothetical protein
MHLPPISTRKKGRGVLVWETKLSIFNKNPLFRQNYLIIFGYVVPRLLLAGLLLDFSFSKIRYNRVLLYII